MNPLAMYICAILGLFAGGLGVFTSVSDMHETQGSGWFWFGVIEFVTGFAVLVVSVWILMFA